MDDANLLTNAAATADWVREEIRLEDLEVTVHQTRLETLRELLARLEGKPKVRRGRPRMVELGEGRANLPLQMPDRVGGGMAEPEPEHAA